MAIELKPIRNQVIIITGASSGIGLATAKSAAAQGAKVVLAARNKAVLDDVCAEIETKGGQAIAVEADVTSQDDVERIAEAAIERFGGFDTWVNNAGLSVFGRLDEVSDEDSRRLFETNFWGTVYGSLTAIQHLKHRGGALINLGSVLSDVAMPMQGMYSATKHAVKGFTNALRVELEDEGAPISVTLIKPAAIDTPFADHAKNYMDKEPKLPPPVYPPEEVANAILHAAQHPHRDIAVGGASRMMSAMNAAMPGVMDMAARSMINQQKTDKPSRYAEGSLHRAGQDGRVRGGHPGYVMSTSLYTRAALHPAVTIGIVAAAAMTAGALMSGSRRPRFSSRSRY